MPRGPGRPGRHRRRGRTKTLQVLCRQGCGFRCARPGLPGEVPKHNGGIPMARRQGAAIGRVGQGTGSNNEIRPINLADLLARTYFPLPDDALDQITGLDLGLPPRGRERAAARRERQRLEKYVRPRHLHDQFPFVRGPNINSRGVCGRELLAIGRKSQESARAFPPPAFFGSGDFPDSDGPVTSGRGEVFAIRREDECACLQFEELTCVLVAKSQIRTPSLAAEARNFPSGECFSAETISVWPVSGFVSLPNPVSQMWIKVSLWSYG